MPSALSAIKGHRLVAFQPEHVDRPSILRKTEQDRHIVFTAETHNFPTGKAACSYGANVECCVRMASHLNVLSHLCPGSFSFLFYTVFCKRNRVCV